VTSLRILSAPGPLAANQPYLQAGQQQQGYLQQQQQQYRLHQDQQQARSPMSQPQHIVLNRTTANAVVTPTVMGARPAVLATGAQPVLVQAGQRLAAPGQGAIARPATVQTAITRGRQDIVITQPGAAPGTPGSRIQVPLATLQNLQPGQGIPTGQSGHLLVKTANGQYQILKVGESTAGAGATIATVSNSLPTQPVPQAVIGAVATRPPVATALPQRPALLTGATAPAAAVAAVNRPAAATAGGGLGGGQQMTPDTAKLKCKNFLATLLRLASEQPREVATNVRGLIQGLVDGRVEPENFTTRLQQELNSSPQPCLVPFLRRSLPFLQQSLRNGELIIEGVRPPPGGSAGVNLAVQSPLGQAVRMAPRGPHVITTARPIARPIGVRLQGVRPTATPVSIPNRVLQRPGAATGPRLAAPTAPHVIRVRKEPSSGVVGGGGGGGGGYSAAGDEDINDVAAMGGVNLAEESQRMQGPTDLLGGAAPRSLGKDDTFLQTGLLGARVAGICRRLGLTEAQPPAETLALLSHAVQDRLKTLVEQLSVVAEHRMDVVRLEAGERYEPTQVRLRPILQHVY